MTRKIPFSEREGIVKPRQILVGDLSPEVRVRLWNLLHGVLLDQAETQAAISYGQGKEYEVVLSLWCSFFYWRADHFNRSNRVHAINEAFEALHWARVLDLLEFVYDAMPKYMRDPFAVACNVAFEEELSGYRLIDGQIVPITREEEIASIEKAVDSPVDGVRVHIRSALSLLADRNDPNFRKSIDESILAVEAAARHVTGSESATLGDALKVIRRGDGDLHPALLQGFEKIYGYTSDADGIRHAFSADDKGDVEPDLADARFMLVACSAFVGYLLDKTK